MGIGTRSEAPAVGERSAHTVSSVNPFSRESVAATKQAQSAQGAGSRAPVGARTAVYRRDETSSRGSRSPPKGQYDASRDDCRPAPQSYGERRRSPPRHEASRDEQNSAWQASASSWSPSGCGGGYFGNTDANYAAGNGNGNSSARSWDTSANGWSQYSDGNGWSQGGASPAPPFKQARTQGGGYYDTGNQW